MKKSIRTVLVLFVVFVMTFGLCSCDTIKSLLEDSNTIVGNDEETRETRITGAQNKATDALKTYTTNITMLGIASSAENGTVFVVEVGGYYIEFVYEGADFNTDGNPDVLPMSDPYANRDDYTLVTGEAVDKVAPNVTIYAPKD